MQIRAPTLCAPKKTGSNEDGLAASHGSAKTASTTLSRVILQEVERGVLVRGPIGGHLVGVATRQRRGLRTYSPRHTGSEGVVDMTQALRIAWYRYRATFALQLSGYLSIVLLIGLI